MLHRKVKCLLTACFAMGASFSLAGDLKITARPLYEGSFTRNLIAPYQIEIQNAGTDTVGTIHISTAGYEMDYPIECPRNSDKAFTVLVPMGYDYGGNDKIIVRTTKGEVKVGTGEPSIGDAAFSTLEIGGRSGEMSFGRRGSLAVADCYVSPENALDRIQAYNAFSLVYLGEGSERATDDAVQAIHRYVLRGGTVVIPSGTSSPLLADGRWRALMPVIPGQPRAVSATKLLLKLGDSAPKEQYSALDFEPKPSVQVLVDGNVKMAAIGRFGLGRVVFLAFDPLHGSLRDWDGRGPLLQKLVSDNGAHAARALRETFVTGGSGRYDRYGGYSSYGGYNPYDTETINLPQGRYFSNTDLERGFQMDPPSSGTIFWILALYFIAVIPVNFIVLHKLKRRELAWLTGPVISLGFAAAMLSQAQALYKLKTSSATGALIIAQQGYPAALASGKSLMFFSRTGQYDLGLNGVEQISPIGMANYRYSNQGGGLAALAAIDTGEVKIPAAQPGNLDFLEFGFNQPVVNEIAVLEKQGSTYLIHAKQNLQTSVLVTKDGAFDVGTLAKGESKSIDLSKSKPVQQYQAKVTSTEALTMGRPTEQAEVNLGPEVAAACPYAMQGETVLLGTTSRGPIGPNVGTSLSDKCSYILFARLG